MLLNNNQSVVASIYFSQFFIEDLDENDRIKKSGGGKEGLLGGML